MNSRYKYIWDAVHGYVIDNYTCLSFVRVESQTLISLVNIMRFKPCSSILSGDLPRGILDIQKIFDVARVG
jgi:hypothetical protein